jgi:dTDP-4-amino-4,6-dideoxygalactose transaminase
MVVTNDEALFEKMKILRAHGSSPKYYHSIIGGNFRLDEIQAAVLLVKLKYLDTWTEKRQKNALVYDGILGGISDISIAPPKALPGYRHIYNQYCIRTTRRNALKTYLSENDVSTEIYYPVPMHLQECFTYLGHTKGDFPTAEEAALSVLALPVYPEINEEALKYTTDSIKHFLRSADTDINNII